MFKNRGFISGERLLEYPSRGQRGNYHLNDKCGHLYLCGCCKGIFIRGRLKIPKYKV